jgi:hypothetical protein
MLSQRARVVLDTLLPSEADPTLRYGIFDTDFDIFWSEVERTALPAWRWGFNAALWTANWIAPLLIHRWPPLSRQDRQTRERALAAMETSRFYLLRQMMDLLKTVVCLGYGADRNVRNAIGYPQKTEHSRPQVSK